MRKYLRLLSIVAIFVSVMCSCTKDTHKVSHVGEEIHIHTESLPTKNNESSADSSQQPSSDILNAAYNIEIYNDTGMDFLELRVSEYREYKWSENLLNKKETFKNKSTYSFHIDNIKDDKTYDIKCISNDNKEFVWENLALSNISAIELKIEDYLPCASFKTK